MSELGPETRRLVALARSDGALGEARVELNRAQLIARWAGVAAPASAAALTGSSVVWKVGLAVALLCGGGGGLLYLATRGPRPAGGEATLRPTDRTAADSLEASDGSAARGAASRGAPATGASALGALVGVAGGESPGPAPGSERGGARARELVAHARSGTVTTVASSAIAAPGHAAARPTPVTSAARPTLPSPREPSPRELPVTARAPVTPQAPPGKGAAALAGDIDHLRQARAALASGDPRRALALLDERPAIADGPLGEECNAARVLVLCSMGRQEEGRRLADVFLKRHPASPHSPQVRSACPAR